MNNLDLKNRTEGRAYYHRQLM